MTPTQAPEASSALSTDVRAFATEQGVEGLLARLVEMTARVFPTTRAFELTVAEDPDLVDERHFVFTLRVATASVSEALEAWEEWHRELVRLCPAQVRCGFQLSMELSD